MIEFLQDYTTKSLPPEVFKNEDRVERSPESELYFVRLGIAAYVGENGLIDADYRPVTRKVIAVVEAETAADLAERTGRGGEVPATVALPGQATTGPGNAVMMGSDVVDPVPPVPAEAPTDAVDAAAASSGAKAPKAPKA